jgi:hypothetical protein
MPKSACVADLNEMKMGISELFNPQYLDSAPRYDFLNAIITNQTEKRVLKASADTKCKSYKVFYESLCDTALVDGTDSCDFTGVDEDGVKCETYNTVEAEEGEFAIDRTLYKCEEDSGATYNLARLDYNKFLAKKIANYEKKVLQKMTTKIIAKFEASLGQNKMVEPYDVTATETYVPVTAWNGDLYGYLEQVKEFNEMTNPIVISSNAAINRDLINMQLTSITAPRQEKLALYKEIGFYFDLFNIKSVIGGDATKEVCTLL